MAHTDLEDSFLNPTEGPGTFSELSRILKAPLQKALEGDDAPTSKEVAEVVTMLLAYSVAIERVLASASGAQMRGKVVPVRAYVEQALTGEARAAAVLRLNNYFKDAIAAFMRVYAGQAKAILQFAEDLARAMRPSLIEDRVRPNPILKLFNLHEGAYWREFLKEYRNLDADGLQEMAEKQRQNTG